MGCSDVLDRFEVACRGKTKLSDALGAAAEYCRKAVSAGLGDCEVLVRTDKWSRREFGRFADMLLGYAVGFGFRFHFLLETDYGEAEIPFPEPGVAAEYTKGEFNDGQFSEDEIMEPIVITIRGGGDAAGEERFVLIPSKRRWEYFNDAGENRVGVLLKNPLKRFLKSWRWMDYLVRYQYGGAKPAEGTVYELEIFGGKCAWSDRDLASHDSYRPLRKTDLALRQLVEALKRQM